MDEEVGEPPAHLVINTEKIIDDESGSPSDKFFPKEKPTHSFYPDSSNRSSYMSCGGVGYSGV